MWDDHPPEGSAVAGTSTPEFHQRVDSLLARLRPQVDKHEWNRFITPFDNGVWGTLLVNVLALANAGSLQLDQAERRELDELLAGVGVTRPEAQAAPVEQDVRHH